MSERKFCLRAPVHRQYQLSTYNLSEQSSQCRFFHQLPPDIRHYIYLFIFGGGPINIYRSSDQPGGRDDRKLYYIRCLQFENQPHKAQPYWKRRICCKTAGQEGTLAFLQMCRQSYIEGIDLLYSSSPFHFVNLPELSAFIDSVRPNRLAAIRRLHVDVDTWWLFDRPDSASYGMIWVYIRSAIERHMSGLKILTSSTHVWTRDTNQSLVYFDIRPNEETQNGRLQPVPDDRVKIFHSEGLTNKGDKVYTPSLQISGFCCRVKNGLMYSAKVGGFGALRVSRRGLEQWGHQGQSSHQPSLR